MWCRGTLASWQHGRLYRVTQLDFDPDALRVYCSLEDNLQHFSPAEALHLAGEVRRVMTALAEDPAQPWLTRLRFFDPEMYYGVVIYSGTGVEFDVIIFWTHSKETGKPTVLDINTRYLR